MFTPKRIQSEMDAKLFAVFNPHLARSRNQWSIGCLHRTRPDRFHIDSRWTYRSQLVGFRSWRSLPLCKPSLSMQCTPSLLSINLHLGITYSRLKLFCGISPKCGTARPISRPSSRSIYYSLILRGKLSFNIYVDNENGMRRVLQQLWSGFTHEEKKILCPLSVRFESTAVFLARNSPQERRF